MKDDAEPAHHFPPMWQDPRRRWLLGAGEKVTRSVFMGALGKVHPGNLWEVERTSRGFLCQELLFEIDNNES